MRLFPDLWPFRDLQPHSFDFITPHPPWRSSTAFSTMSAPASVLMRMAVLGLTAEQAAEVADMLAAVETATK